MATYNRIARIGGHTHPQTSVSCIPNSHNRVEKAHSVKPAQMDPAFFQLLRAPVSQLWGCKHRLPFPKKSSRRPVNEREEGRQQRRAPTAKRFRVWNSRSFGTIPSGRIGKFSALISRADLPWKPRSSKWLPDPQALFQSCAVSSFLSSSCLHKTRSETEH